MSDLKLQGQLLKILEKTPQTGLKNILLITLDDMSDLKLQGQLLEAFNKIPSSQTGLKNILLSVLNRMSDLKLQGQILKILEKTPQTRLNLDLLRTLDRMSQDQSKTITIIAMKYILISKINQISYAI